MPLSKIKFLFLPFFVFLIQSSSFAQQPAPLSNEQLTTLVLQLQRELKETRTMVIQQNEVIHVLKDKVEQKGQAVPIPPPVPAETKKPRSLGENLRHYLLEKPESVAKDEEKLPAKAGMGSVEVGALLQEWYTFKDERAHSNFRNRRIELGLKGRLTDHLLWGLVIDPSLVREDNTTRSILKDAYVAFDGIPHHVIKLGQYKIPVTEEGFRSSALIDTIERSFIGTTFGDKRDIGIMADAKWKYLDYQIGVFNGDELNRFDTNDQKDVVARFVLKPFQDVPLLKGLEGGSSMYYRATNGTASEKKRIGLEGRYEYKNFSLKSEYMKGQDGATVANGWYVQTGYFVLPRWQPIVRFEGFNPNEGLSSSHEYDTILGLNYFLIHPKTKLQFNYVHKDATGINGTTDDQIIAAAQYAF